MHTVHRTEQSFQACNDIVSCFVERAKVEKQYAQQLSQWSSKWKPIVDSRKFETLREASVSGIKSNQFKTTPFKPTTLPLFNGLTCLRVLLSSRQVEVVFPSWFHDSPLLYLLCHSSLCIISPSPGPLYGSLMRAWQCFFTSAERLSVLHSSISQSLVAEEGNRVKTWQKGTFPKKLFCGFKESHDNNTSFSRAQKPWSKKLTKVQQFVT